MANIKKPAISEPEDVFTVQVNANYQRAREAREKAAKERKAEERNSRRIALWGTLGSLMVIVAGFATWFI